MSLIVKDLVKMGETQLIKAGCPEPKLDAELLYCHMKNIGRTEFIMEWSDVVEDRICEQYFDLVAIRATRRPLQHIVGTQEFMGLTFGVREDVLIPRHDTETVVEKAEEILKKHKIKTVLDLCCGSGIIGISLAKRNPGLKVTATDISAAAKALTESNAKRNGVKINVQLGDLFTPLGRKKYDMIVSNPPYIPREVIGTLDDEVRRFEPQDALDGGPSGLDFYHKIITGAPGHLDKAGWLVLEIGHDQAKDVVGMIEETGAFEEVAVYQDLAGHDRTVAARLAGKKKAKGKPSKEG
jgi:release factor glutamine methyltransferase